MRLGFTGTRTALTEVQVKELDAIVRYEDGRLVDFHHGDCVGADATAHEHARAGGLFIVVHPPSDPKLRAWCIGNKSRPPAAYHVRNRNIVDQTDWLLAMPRSREERGGTWMTINFARERERPVLIVYPDGSFDEERMS